MLRLFPAALLLVGCVTFAFSADAMGIRHAFGKGDRAKISWLEEGRPLPPLSSHLAEFEELDDFPFHRRIHNVRRQLVQLLRWLDHLEARYHDDADSDTGGTCSFRTPQYCGPNHHVDLDNPTSPSPGAPPSAVTPEPGTALLLLTGLGGLALQGRRRTR